MLRLLHISDIHFASYWDSRPPVDVEKAVRGLMLRDFDRMRSQLGNMDGILLVGDVANWGKTDEYEKAFEFLDAAATVVGCAVERVVCVPGNHDIDRSRQNYTSKVLRSHLRAIDARDVNDELLRALGEPATADSLFRPIEAYNEFALRYQCDISPDKPTFAPKTFPLGDIAVQVHGINSSWICDGTEQPNDANQSLVIGLFQALPVTTDESTVSIVLCHHPLRWSRDGVALLPWLANAHLVLTGHEHEAGLHQDSEGRPLYVASGAVNPSRAEDGWLPAYNVIEIDHHPGDPNVAVNVHTRVWREGVRAEFGYSPEFGGGGRRFSVPIMNLQHRPGSPGVAQLHPDPPVQAHERKIAPPQPEAITSAVHQHVHAIMRAPADLRRAEAEDMGLIDPGHPDGLALDRLIVQRALTGGVAGQLATRLLEKMLDG